MAGIQALGPSPTAYLQGAESKVEMGPNCRHSPTVPQCLSLDYPILTGHRYPKITKGGDLSVSGHRGAVYSQSFGHTQGAMKLEIRVVSLP